MATPALLDPHFDHTVVLLLDHDEDGSLGVVLNRPTGVGVDTVLADWADQVVGPPVVFEGGPVSPDAALALAFLTGDGPADPVGFRRLFGSTGVMDLDTPHELLDPRVTGCASSPGTPGGGAVSSRPRSRRAPGTCSTPPPATRSAPTPSGCGPRCCAGSPARWPGPRRDPSTRPSTDETVGPAS